MAVTVVTWVLLQAILLCGIHCNLLKKGGSTGHDSFKAPASYQPYEPVGGGPGYDSTSYQPGPGDQYGSVGYIQTPQSASSHDVSWAIPPPGIFSGGETALMASNADLGYVSPPYPPPIEFIPGAMSRVESTLEDGGYESETQERGFPPLPPPPPYYEAAVDVFGSPAGPGAVMSIGYPGSFYPYDWQFLTGQYPPGTYTHSSSSVERGRDGWQENHYLRYDYPAGPGGEQQGKTFPSASDQMFKQEPAYGKAMASY